MQFGFEIPEDEGKGNGWKYLWSGYVCVYRKSILWSCDKSGA